MIFIFYLANGFMTFLFLFFWCGCLFRIIIFLFGCLICFLVLPLVFALDSRNIFESK